MWRTGSLVVAGVAVIVLSSTICFSRTAFAAPAAAPAAPAAPAASAMTAPSDAASPEALPPGQQGEAYGGTQVCKMCHPDVFKDWSKSKHSQGFQLLVNVGEDKDEKCLPCHTTGYGKGGFVDDATTPNLEGTTCEACHGPGATHMGNKAKITRIPSAKVCGDCHQKASIHSVPGM
ncbi:MAG: multiheme c-type cytochrome [Capsulimonadaceae bacterium]